MDLLDIHKLFKKIVPSNLDYTYKDGSKCINSIAAIYNILNYIKDSAVLEINSIFNTDHRVSLVDINIAEYFEDNFSNWN